MHFIFFSWRKSVIEHFSRDLTVTWYSKSQWQNAFYGNDGGVNERYWQGFWPSQLIGFQNMPWNSKQWGATQHECMATDLNCSASKSTILRNQLGYFPNAWLWNVSRSFKINSCCFVQTTDKLWRLTGISFWDAVALKLYVNFGVLAYSLTFSLFSVAGRHLDHSTDQN